VGLVGAQLAKEKHLVFTIKCDLTSERVIGRVPNLKRILGNLVNTLAHTYTVTNLRTHTSYANMHRYLI
jgi:hypothetical protein